MRGAVVMEYGAVLLMPRSPRTSNLFQSSDGAAPPTKPVSNARPGSESFAESWWHRERDLRSEYYVREPPNREQTRIGRRQCPRDADTV